jgi:hypothetical protein
MGSIARRCIQAIIVVCLTHATAADGMCQSASLSQRKAHEGFSATRVPLVAVRNDSRPSAVARAIPTFPMVVPRLIVAHALR